MRRVAHPFLLAFALATTLILAFPGGGRAAGPGDGADAAPLPAADVLSPADAAATTGDAAPAPNVPPDAPPPTPAEPPPAPEPPRPVAEQAPLQSDTYDGLASAWWNSFVTFIDKDNFAEILVRVGRDLDRVRRDNGIPNLPDAATALVRAAQERAAGGDTTTAQHLLQAALGVAPDLPHPHYVMASLIWQEDRGKVFDALSHIFRGWAKEWQHLPSRMRLLGNQLTLGLLTYLIVLFLFALIQLRRHFANLAHDLSHLFPRGVSQFQAGLFTLLLLFVPLVASLGVLTLLAFWLVALWWYQSRQERAVSVALVLILLLSPFLARLTASTVGFFNSPTATVYSCLSGPCSRPEVERLEQSCKSPDAPRLACFAVGMVRARQGGRTRGLLDEASIYLASLDNETGSFGHAAVTAYANVLQAKAIAHCSIRRQLGGTGVDETYRRLASKALAAYDRAAELGPAAIPYYNKSLMLRRLGKADEAEQSYRLAVDEDEAAVLALDQELKGDRAVSPCTESFNLNRTLGWASLPMGTLFSSSLSAQHVMEAELPFLHGVLVGNLSTVLLIGVGGGAVVLMLLLSLVRGLVRPSWRCSQCKQVGCVRCRRELAHLDICDSCLFIRVKGSFVDAKELWFRERRIQSEESTRRRVSRLLSLVLPGSGHLYRGDCVVGVILITLFTGSILNAVGGAGLAPSTVIVSHGAGVVGSIAWGLVAGIVYIVGLVSILRQKN